jgi:hypothetical protein
MSDYYGELTSCLRQDLHGLMALSPSQYASAEGLQSCIFKKCITLVDPQAERRGLEKFLEVNGRCGLWTLQMSSDRDKELVGEAKNFIYRFLLDSGLPSLTFAHILNRGRMGPGSSILASGFDFYTKLFSSQLSTTRLLLDRAFRLFFDEDPRYRSAEILRRYSFGDPVVVPGNRLSFVPKSNDICRTICTEPSLNMFFQLGLGEWLAERLRSKVGINLSTQQFVNRRLARIGSRTDRFSTIDLSSASDSLSLGMVSEMFPRDFVAWLHLLRSPVSSLPFNGGTVNLNMISTMGNGYTFPLQTLLFTACVVSALRVSGIKPRFRKGRRLPNFAVFGDDIIIPTECLDDLLRLLHLLGFVVNSDKTFHKGPFRESCGGDYYRGRPVRPVYLRSLETPQDRCVAINRLNEWTAMTGIPLRNCVQYLIKTVPFRPVPLWENLDAGIRLPLSLAGRLRKSRRYQSPIYRRWVAAAPQLKVTDEVIVPRRARRRIFNPYGLWISFLRGDMERGKIPIRSLTATRYMTKTSVAPNWDHETTNPFSWGFGGRMSLLAASALNLEQV